MHKFYVVPLSALALGLASQASALTIAFQYEGVKTFTGSKLFVDSLGFSAIELPSSTEDATRVEYNFTPSIAGFNDGVGTVTLVGGTLDFSFEGISDNDGNGMAGALLSLSNGTGAYVGYTGTGIISHTDNPTTQDLVGGQFYADIQAVPEPASMLALGVAGVTFLRRRSKKVSA